MSDRDSYTFEEWSLVRSIPALVTAGVAVSDPSGIIGTFNEAKAGEDEFDHFAADNHRVELLAALAEDTDFHPAPNLRAMLRRGDPAEAAEFTRSVIAKATDALAVVRRRGSPDEVTAYRELLSHVAHEVADAAIEGGHFWTGGVRISEKEQAFLDALNAALAAADNAAPAASTTSPA